tara:strand:+ start:1304 stop:2437 length:1134 start_codon:yes stop_codon:yes gene_type:complete
MKKRKKIFYIAEVSLNSKSAYLQQVLKMCDAFAMEGHQVILFVINSKNINFSTLKRKYLLKSIFQIKPIFKDIQNMNLFLRLIFSFKIFTKLQIKDIYLIYSRSFISSIVLSILGKKNLLEIHQKTTGTTKYLFKILKSTFFIKKIFFVLINKRLNDYYNFEKKKFIVLDDAVDLKDFAKHNKLNIKKSCVYTGSLFHGKGFEIIIKLSKRINSLNFYVYGDLKTASQRLVVECKKIKNLHLMGHISYNKIPQILKSHKIILMPYGKRVMGNHKSVDISDHMSPLKLFDYLAAGQIILASKHKSYSHVLKNNFNAFLCDIKNTEGWVKTINDIFKNKKNLNKIKKNSILTARKYTWQKRVLKIIKYSEQKKINYETF